MVEIVFDKNASRAEHIEEKVVEFLHRVSTLEQDFNAPILVFQDGKSNAYYIKCNLSGDQAVALCDINARLNAESKEAYRSNRELLLKNITYKKMKADALLGREFNDIIVEYMTTYEPIKPLKVWGGQHRIHAIMDANHEVTRNHGFRVYFDLDTTQRNELALISNTSIAVSKDTFDRMLEETVYGDALRKWCRGVKLLPEDADFPDTRSRSELITLKLARTFLVNFYQGKNKGNDLDAKDLGRFVYEPIVVKTGITGDAAYAKVRENTNILADKHLLEAGRKFAELNGAQLNAFRDTAMRNKKIFGRKAFVESVLCGWSFIAGLLQTHHEELARHYGIPPTN